MIFGTGWQILSEMHRFNPQTPGCTLKKPSDPNRDQAQAANPQFKIARWNIYDHGGFSTSRRSLARQFRTKLSAIYIGSKLAFLGVWGTCWACFPTVALQSFIACWFVTTIGSKLIERRARQKYERLIGEQGDSSDQLVHVSLRVSGSEYGQDVGTLSFQQDWLFFEGERTMFSLRKGDFTLRADGSMEPESSGVRLFLTQTGRNISIKLNSILGDETRIRTSFLKWISESNATDGITLLPPLEASRQRDFDRLQGIRSSLSNVQYYIFLYLVLGSLMGARHWPSTELIKFQAILALSLAFAIGWDCLQGPMKRWAAFKILHKTRHEVESSALPSEADPSLPQTSMYGKTQATSNATIRESVLQQSHLEVGDSPSD